MRTRIRAALIALTLLAALGVPAAAPADTGVAADGEGSDTMRHVANLQYPLQEGSGAVAISYGTDMEFATLTASEAALGIAAGHLGVAPDEVPDADPDTDGVQREYAVAGSYINGMQLVDITDPENAFITGTYDCWIAQGDVQVFTQEGDDRVFATYTADDISSRTNTQSGCYADIGWRPSMTRYGSFIVDITDPANPTTVSFAPFPKGSHNQTVHPLGNYLYNSNSDLITSVPNQAIEIFDISDIENPKSIGALSLPVRPGLGTESHDITFNADGTRAYSAALSQTVIINTEDPANPWVISTIFDPMINVEHQSDPITLTDPVLGEREFLIVEDEVAGALPTGQCPNGGVHVYDITGELENNPVKVGYWNIAEVRPATNEVTGGLVGESDISRCTAHVFQLHPEAGLMTIAYYNGGVRVVDISGLVGVALGDAAAVGMRQIGYYQFADSDTWSAKTNKINEDGSFYLYGNDVARGFDIYEFDPTGEFPEQTGTWMTPAEAALVLDGDAVGADYRPYCLLQS